ncbi:DUF3224 domain-containing protein [Nonomuraea sp. NPDC049158]|uniref:DUF3224 domain-containing protein n=1 Tax=Nonomuraea sp. NPDC049158 TaxID=3155649 RepID=UPI0033E208B0
MSDPQVERTVKAGFEIVEFDESLYDKHADGPNLTRVTIRKRYQGVIEGTLDGRQGTLVIQHWGLADGTDQNSEGSIVPNSGTG